MSVGANIVLYPCHACAWFQALNWKWISCCVIQIYVNFVNFQHAVHVSNIESNISKCLGFISNTWITTFFGLNYERHSQDRNAVTRDDEFKNEFDCTEIYTSYLWRWVLLQQARDFARTGGFLWVSFFLTWTLCAFLHFITRFFTSYINFHCFEFFLSESDR